MSGIWLEIDGEPIKATECCWLTYEPCGCASGVCRVEVGGDEVLTTEEQALKFIAPNRALREEFARDGRTLVLAPRSTFSVMVDAKTFGKCPHIPLWGIEPTPIPEGMVWATSDRTYGRHTNIKHLIDGEQVMDWSGKSRPLCGRVTNATYDSERWSIDDCAECVKCRTAAMAGSPALAVSS